MRPYQHLLFATDLSEADQPAALRAGELARKFRARLTLLHVIDDFPENVPINPAPENVDPASFLEARARRGLVRLACLIGRERAAKKVVFSTRSAKHVIVSVAREVDADLIVLAASGHHLMAGRLSTTSGVLNDAGCDIMLIRTPTAAQHQPASLREAPVARHGKQTARA
jgi:universal stress protein A